jgi:hypothetical protein
VKHAGNVPTIARDLHLIFDLVAGRDRDPGFREGASRHRDLGAVRAEDDAAPRRRIERNQPAEAAVREAGQGQEAFTAAVVP